MVASHLAGRAKSIGAIYTSPLVRAVQTGEVLAQALRFDGPVGVLIQLASGCAPPAFLGAVPRASDDVVLIGHLPSIQAYAEWLLGREVPAFGKSAILGVDLGNGSPPGRFLWMLGPGPAAVDRLP